MQTSALEAIAARYRGHAQAVRLEHVLATALAGPDDELAHAARALAVRRAARLAGRARADPSRACFVDSPLRIPLDHPTLLPAVRHVRPPPRVRRLQVGHLQEGHNTLAYVRVASLGGGAVDRAWVNQADSKAQLTRDKLELDLAAYKANHIKESTRVRVRPRRVVACGRLCRHLPTCE